MPRKANLTLYLTNCESTDTDLLADLGKYKTGKGLLYFKRSSDAGKEVLEQLIKRSSKI